MNNIKSEVAAQLQKEKECEGSIKEQAILDSIRNIEDIKQSFGNPSRIRALTILLTRLGVAILILIFFPLIIIALPVQMMEVGARGFAKDFKSIWYKYVLLTCRCISIVFRGK